MDINEDALHATPVQAPSLGGWNWGAAFLSIPWGIGNKSYLTLLSLVPVLNVFWWIVCGVNGNKWAWNSGLFRDDESFYAAQGTWNRAGITVVALSVIAVIGVIVGGAALVSALEDFSNNVYGSAMLY